MKRILISLLVSLIAIPMQAGSGTTTIDGIVYGYEYTIEQSASSYHINANVTVTDGSQVQGNVELPAYITVDDNVSLMVTNIGTAAFRGNTSIKKIVIPGGIVHLHDNAFEGCTSLEEVVILEPTSEMPSDGLTYIDDGAFGGCTSLTSINIPNTVRRIGYIFGAFSGCTSLKSISLPGGINIPLNCFADCTNLETVTFRGTINKIERDAFRSCISLKSIDLSKGVKELDRAFWGCSGLKSVTFPETGLTRIGEYCFADCSSLEYINIPASVTLMEDGACRNCTSLKEAVVQNCDWFAGQSHFLGCTSLTKVTITGASEMSNYMFIGCTNLKTVILNKVKTIGWEAFHGCSSLESITIPNTVTRICGSAFEGCI